MGLHLLRQACSLHHYRTEPDLDSVSMPRLVLQPHSRSNNHTKYSSPRRVSLGRWVQHRLLHHNSSIHNGLRRLGMATCLPFQPIPLLYDLLLRRIRANTLRTRKIASNPPPAQINSPSRVPRRFSDRVVRSLMRSRPRHPRLPVRISMGWIRNWTICRRIWAVPLYWTTPTMLCRLRRCPRLRLG